jgi:predicted dehydrogenase
LRDRREGAPAKSRPDWTSWMKLRVGLIGLGDAWEARHRGALRALSDKFEVRAVCSEVAQRAEQVAREFGAAAVDGFRMLAERDDVDAVLILSSEWYGPLPILAACEAGKAVYCAAPLEIDPAKAKEVKRRVEESGVAFMAEFPRRHSPATLRLKELIATRLGPARLLFCHQRILVEKGNHVRERTRRVPLAMRHLMELVDWCRYVVANDPTSVVGVRHRGVMGDDDYEMMSLDFSTQGETGTGPMAQISCGHYMPARWHEAIHFRPPAALQVCCENGIAFVDLPQTLIWFDDAGQHLESLTGERPVGEQLLTHFHRAVTSLVRKTSDLEDAYRALHVALTAAESRRCGQRLELDF